MVKFTVEVCLGGGMSWCIHGWMVLCRSGSKSDGDLSGEIVSTCQMSKHFGVKQII